MAVASTRSLKVVNVTSGEDEAEWERVDCSRFSIAVLVASFAVHFVILGELAAPAPRAHGRGACAHSTQGWATPSASSRTSTARHSMQARSKSLGCAELRHCHSR
jgi:hypothetical protein